ncbi:MAG: hypothetical protein ACOH5I_16660 [Oligoflexus sp.]
MIPQKKIDIAELLHKLTDDKKKFPQGDQLQTSQFEIQPQEDDGVSGKFTFIKYVAGELVNNMQVHGESTDIDLVLTFKSNKQPVGLLLERIERLKNSAPEKVDAFIDKIATDQEQSEEDSEKLGKNFVTVVPPINIGKGRLIIEEKWEGVIDVVKSDSFVCTLRSILSDKTERCEFELDEVPEPDRDLVKKGAVFNWYIGLRLEENGRQQRVSEIRFRRLPDWRFVSRDKVRAQIERYSNLLFADSGKE